jgi:hypothetical protein
MRILSILFLCLSVFTISSCGDDEDMATATALSAEAIIGDWNLTAYNNGGDIIVVGLGSNTFTSSITNSNVVVTFGANGNWSSVGDYDITVVTPDTTETTTYDDGIGMGTYTVTSTQLVLSGINAGDDADLDLPTVLNVAEYSVDNLLRLRGNTRETFMDPVFGLTVSVDLDTEMTLER